MSLGKKIFHQNPASTGDADAAQGLVLYLDANDEDSIEAGGANTGAGSGTWFDIAGHDLNVPLADKASNLQLHLNASDATSYNGSGTTWTDISGNSRNATINGGVESTYTTGIRGSFDLVQNSGDYFEIPHHNDISPSSNGITFESWVTPDNVNATNNIFYIGNDLGFGEFSGGTNSATAFISTMTSSAYVNNVSTGNVITAGKLHHIVFTMSNVTNPVVNIYVDGTLQITNTGSGTVIDTNANLKIGRYSTGNANDFDGKIHAVRVYNTVLTASEIAQNFRAGNFLSYSSIYSTDLVTNLDAANYTSGNWADSVGSNDGTLNNMTAGDNFDKELGNYFELNGSNEYISIGATGTLDTGNVKTFEIWFQSDESSAGHILTRSESSSSFNQRAYAFRVNGGNFDAFFYSGNSNKFSAGGDAFAVTIGEWTHAAVTIAGTTSGSAVKVYKNGIVAASGTLSGDVGTDSSFLTDIGRRNFSSADYFNGKIGAVKFHSSELTSAQVAQNYLATKNDYPNGINFTINNAVFNTSGYFVFNGTNTNCSTTGAPSALINATGFTVSAWFWRTNGETGAHTIVGQSHDNGNSGQNWILQVVSNTVYFHLYGTDNYAGVSDIISHETWTHLAGVVEADGVKRIYKNGVVQLSTSAGYSADTVSTYNTFVGNLGAINWHHGRIGAVKYYKKPLTADELLADFNATKGTYGL